MTITDYKDADGDWRTHSDDGSPLLYIVEDGSGLCGRCMTECDERDVPRHVFHLTCGSPETCDACGREIETRDGNVL